MLLHWHLSKWVEPVVVPFGFRIFHFSPSGWLKSEFIGIFPTLRFFESCGYPIRYSLKLHRSSFHFLTRSLEESYGEVLRVLWPSCEVFLIVPQEFLPFPRQVLRGVLWWSSSSSAGILWGIPYSCTRVLRLLSWRWYLAFCLVLRVIPAHALRRAKSARFLEKSCELLDLIGMF